MDNSVFNHSRSGMAESVIDAIEIITDQKLNSAKFDRTIQATVLSCTSNTKGEYRCRYQDSKFLAYAPNPDVTYSENALVYILIPGNDWDATKTIIGTVDKLGVDYIATISNKDYFDPIGNNIIDGNAGFALISWEGSRFYTIYEKDVNNAVGLNIEKVEDYFKESNATHFYVQADFKTNIENPMLGHYGIKITTSRASKDGTKEYYFMSEDMEGEPRHFTNYSMQGNLKKPFLIETTIDNNEEINDFGEIQKIEIFVDNYYEEEGHEPDILIQNFQMGALHRLSEMDMTDGYLSIITPAGSVFYRNGGSIIPSLVRMVARVRMNGIISDDPDIKYYWFRRDARVYGGAQNGYQNYYCPIPGINTNGWACLNNSTPNGNERNWDPAGNEWALSINDVPAKEMYYMCVAIYDDMIMQREITIRNKAAQYDIVIQSSAGYHFYQDQGETILTCEISPIPADIHYYWAEVTSEGIFNTKWSDRPSSYPDQVEAIDIIGFTKYFCTIYSENMYIGTGYCVLTNSDIATAGTYYLNITNGSQSFTYNEEGCSPVMQGQKLLPLEVEFYDSQGNQLTPEEVLRSTNVKWYLPQNYTMLEQPDIPEEPEDYTDEITGIKYWVYKDIVNFPFKIADYYNYTAQLNQIKLTVEYNGNTYIDKTTFSFVPQGGLGTNGTKYTISIIPNSTSDFYYSRVWVTEPSDPTKWHWNFTPKPNEFPFKVRIYRGAELLFSGYESGTQHDIQFGIKWEILDGDNKSIFSVNPPYYLGFPTGTFPPTKTKFNNILKVTVTIGTEDGKTIYSFLPIGVTKIKNSIYDDYNIGLKLTDINYSGFTFALYNADGENPLYDELYPFEPSVMNGDTDETASFNLQPTFIGSNLIFEGPDDDPPNLHILPSDYYEGIDVNNAVVYNSPNNFIIYAPVVFTMNRYRLASLNAWDGTHIEINNEGGYIYAPQMGAGIKEDDNSFTGVLLGKVNIPNSTDKVGFMAYGKGRRTVWIDAYTGKAEFGAGKGRIILDPQTEDALIYGGAQETDPTAGMVINLNEPSIKWNNGNFEIDKDGMIQAITMKLYRPNSEDIYFQLDPYGLAIDVGNGDYPYNKAFPSASKRKILVFDSRYDPQASQMKDPTNAVAEFGDDGVVLQAQNAHSYLRMKNASDDPTVDKGPNVALKSGNALYLTSGIAIDSGGHPIIPTDSGEDYVSNASVNIKAAYNANIWAGHGLTIRVTKPHEKDEGAHSNYPDIVWDDTYGYLKLETQYGWLYMSPKAGGKKNTPGIGINAYTWDKRQDMGESEDDPYTRYPNQDYKVYINGNEVLTNGNIADSTNGDIGGACYISEFGNLRPYLDNLVSLGSYYEEGDGIAAWRHVVTYDTIQVSDRREKDCIQDMDKRYVNLIMNLRPKKYKYRKTREDEYRTGFIAQEVENVLNDVGLRNKDFGGLKKKPIIMDGQVVDYGYGLNYDDFVAALVLTVQDLQKQINDLKGELKNGIRSFKN